MDESTHERDLSPGDADAPRSSRLRVALEDLRSKQRERRLKKSEQEAATDSPAHWLGEPTASATPPQFFLTRAGRQTRACSDMRATRRCVTVCTCTRQTGLQWHRSLVNELQPHLGSPAAL